MSEEDKGIVGQIRQKLLEAKQKWAAEGRLLTGRAADRADRLPPGQHEVRNWPVLDLGIQPETSIASPPGRATTTGGRA